MKITEILLNLKWRHFSRLYKSIIDNQFKSYSEIKEIQYSELKKLIKFSLKNIPFYKTRYCTLNLNDYKQSDQLLECFSTVNKIEIKKNPELFKRSNRFSKEKSYKMTTGGSTGVPLHYELSKIDMKYSRLLKYKGFSYAGYSIGDPIIFVGGGSLINKPTLKTRIISKFLNSYKFSSYKINEEVFEKIVECIKKEKLVFIYGYASTIYLISKYIISRKYSFVIGKVKGVFPTSEVLHDFQRATMEEAFGNCIFNDYGVNDGGASAHECDQHQGMHLDTERSIIEILDDNGTQVYEGIGKVVVTSLKNYTMPFIRYETGDIAKITHLPCNCGRTTPRIVEIYGRTTDYLTIEGNYIGSPVLTVLMGKLDIDLYQIIQEDLNNVTFKIYKITGFDESEKSYISKHISNSVLSHYPTVQIKISFYDFLPQIDNKFKYIVNKMLMSDINE
jgi:phenylacetate-CoA ligase